MFKKYDLSTKIYVIPKARCFTFHLLKICGCILVQCNINYWIEYAANLNTYTNVAWQTSYHAVDAIVFTTSEYM